MGGKPRVHASLDRTLFSRTITQVTSVGDGPLLIDGPRLFVGSIPGKARIEVTGRLNGVAFSGALIPLGGKRRLVVPQPLAERSGVFAGASATLELELANTDATETLALDPSSGESTSAVNNKL